MQIKNLTKGDSTRRQLIEVGATLFHQQGYHNTGLQQILKQAAVTKGSFYFHFKDKESFALAIIEQQMCMFKETLNQHLGNETLSAEKKIAAFHQFFLGIFTQKQFKGGCPIGNFSQEMADVSGQFADKIKHAFNNMSRCFKAVIEQGQQQGRFKSELDSADTANFMVNSWEGAVLRMKASQNAEPLENWYQYVRLLLIS
jgi:TetR/AcrR family transcriptional regulator, transcriptional repressor for nem operon